MITISAVGDCALGDLQHGSGAPGSFAARLEQVSDRAGYPFSAVVDVFDDDDLTIANLEGTLTARRGFANPVFSIRGEPEYAHMLRRGGVDLVNLANNHSHDYGVDGHEDTKAALRGARVAYFGWGTIDVREIKGTSVVNLGYLGGPSTTMSRMLADVRRFALPNTVVIVSFHWGVEGFYATHTEQFRLGRAAIDAGADLVLGHHPHVLQAIETYHDRHIVYSLGNFVFGANSQPTDLDSVIVQERFHMKGGEVLRVEQRIVPVSISGDRAQNDFRPVLLSGSERDRVLDKLKKLGAQLKG